MRTPSAACYSARHLSDAALLKESAPFAAGERSNQVQLLVNIAEIDFRKLYLPAGYPSMSAYCMDEFRLTEDEALKRVHVARTAREFPLLFEAMDEGRLCLSRVRMLAAHLTPENVEELVGAATSYRSFSDFRRFLNRFAEPDLLTGQPPAVANSQAHGPVIEPAGQEGQACSSDDHPRAEALPLARPAELANSQARGPVTAPVEDSEWIDLRIKVRRGKLQRLRELLSHSVPSGNANLILDRALDAAIEKAEKRKFAACITPRAPRPRSARDRCIPAHVRRAVWDRDGGQCTFVSDKGKRCTARRLLEFDHVEPVARGGKATIDGIRLRCRGHNQYAAERAFGAGFMQKKRDEARAARVASRQMAEQVADAPPPPHPFRDDVIAGLRTLGVSATEARLIVERSGALQQATLEESMRAALRCCGPRGGGRSR